MSCLSETSAVEAFWVSAVISLRRHILILWFRKYLASDTHLGERCNQTDVNLFSIRVVGKEM